ncbi:restriction endonuclease subunit S [Iningainema tapete]|uniref:Restriction endonuclease subunit S n=1 Tax=Iningainema tapete BLCC-T55 TaxID=2748662 RepID=A0A8J7C6H1_9CYAN|nr:restriction endonuclease subunit S [Iningainema tapete]MBD2774314.1 restriction endonuclease subunit S [Iningainema tapete BLCC-T55]
MSRKMICALGQFKDSPLQKIPKDWDIVCLKDEINVLHGYAFVGDYFTDSPPGEVLLVPGNFHREGGIYFNDNNTKYYQGLIPDGTLLNNGDLLIVMTDLSPRTLILGRVVQLQLPFRVLHNQRIGKIVPKLPDTWDKRFLMLVINSDRVRSNIISNATGTTVRHTSPDRITANVVPKPSVREQSKIADIIDTIDAAIAHTEALIHKLKQIKAGLLHDLLTCGLDENGELRDAIAHPEQFKDSPFGRIPKDWDLCPLYYFAQRKKNSFVNGPFGSDLLARELIDEGVPVIYVRDVKSGEYERVSTVHVSNKKAKELSFCDVQYGDVLIAKVGDPPCDAAPYFSYETAIITQDVIRIRPSDDTDTFFLVNLINSQITKKSVETITIAGTRKRVSLTEFKNIEIPKPSLEEQRKISSILREQDRKIHSEEAYLKKLKLQKKGLMHDLLTGKMRVNEIKQ